MRITGNAIITERCMKLLPKENKSRVCEGGIAMGKILIKCFKTPKMKYFYDRFLNSIVMVTDEEYEVLKEVEKTGTLPGNNILSRFVDNGLLQETLIEEIEHPETGNIELLTEHYMENLILQVTQQCNMRCSYCAYSGNYFNRTHSTNRMTFETAKKAIDFYLERSDKADARYISFYGGEPLLEFELIKQCVNYALEKKGDKSIGFPMTTNGTLLTDEVIKFIVKHKFSLMISLDGDKESHDINRRFRTGGGSFDVIINNLKSLKKYDEKYYKENVMFNCVISSTTDFERVYKFYSESDLFAPDTINFHYVNQVGLKNNNISEITQKNRRTESLAYIKMALAVLEKREWDSQSIMLRSEMQNVELLYNQLHKHSIEAKKTHHGGPCIPAVRRLLIDTSGTFFPCERVSEDDEQMSIGSLENGLDYDKINFYLNHGKMIKENCLDCWNLRTCTFCLGEISKDNQNLSKEILFKQCEESKGRTLSRFIRLCILVELGYRGNENLFMSE